MTLCAFDNDGDDGPPGEAAPAAEFETAASQIPTPVRRAVRPCGPSDLMVVLVYHDLDRQFDALQAALPQLGDGDAVDGIHRARNATRRIRGTLRAFRELLPDPPSGALALEMSWLADLLGQVRDLDVHRAGVEQCLARLAGTTATDIEPYLRRSEADHAEARRALAEGLTGERFARLTDDFVAFLDREPSRAALRRSLGFSASDGSAQYAVRAVRKLRKTGRRINRNSPEQLHTLRIRCKRLRYQLESFEEVCDGRLRPALKELKRLQDTLGAHHDATVSIERMRSFVDSARESAEMERCSHALRELIRLQTEEGAAAHKRFRRDWQRFEERVRPRKLRLGHT